MLLAGFTGVFGRLISLNAGLLTWYRLLVSSLLLLGLLAATGRLVRVAWVDVVRLGAVGTLLGLSWVFFYASIQYATISVGVVCISLGGFFAAVLGPMMSRNKFSLTELLFSFLALAGIILIFGFDATHRTGILLGVISSLLITLYTLANERLVTRFDAQTLTLYQLLGGCVCLAPVLLAYLALAPATSWRPSVPDAGYLLLLSLLCTIVPYLLLTLAQQRLSAFTVNLSFNLEPLYGIVLAVLLYQENQTLSIAFYTGLGLIVLSVLLQLVQVALLPRRFPVAAA